MNELAQRLKALADPTRLRVMRLLQHGELCVCDLMAALDLPQSTISRHMAVLRHGGWVDSRRGGKWVYYSLSQPGNPALAGVLDALLAGLPGQAGADEDHARLLGHLAAKAPDACD
ncbi:ArsR/SmtB family transcription factor [Desulfohalovibrio reitneri]|uniref:ArsR/SmtB family transcription factor n=1 Tax=Desulfohalovibrio reitneri TaxID=1307759 RepID=UPI0004A73F23|nr:metalloregulator ArsR/SmtB family transcription factor [Desulfohalovibrio reitneri]